MTDALDCDVLVCGLGPVGQLLANLLGQLGVATIAVDQESEPYDLPRAATIDDEVLRILQSVGLHREVLADAQAQSAVSFVTAAGRVIEVFRPDAGELGHPQLVDIHQPSLEHTMIAGLDRYPNVELRWGHRVEVIDRAADRVAVWVRPTTGGRSFAVRARFLVGCDGGQSAVRASLGVRFGGSTFAQRWLVVDAIVDRPLARAPHPHFVGDPARPGVCLPMSPGRHRWEWMVHPGEDAERLLEPARIRALMAPWLEGERSEVERAVVYTFHARMAERWRVGRVLLAGDAAHLMPPFVGQGFSSGARDAANLAWKLDAVLHGAPQRLLGSYEVERRPHVARMQKLAVRWGRVVQTDDPRLGRGRDAVLSALDRSGVLGWIQERAKPRPAFGSGAFAVQPHRIPFRRSVGSLFPQPQVRSPDGGKAMLDDAIGPGWVSLSAVPVATEALLAGGIPVLELDRDIGDDSGAIEGWLRRNRASWVMLRPDRYVFACGGLEEARACSQSLRRTIGSGARVGAGS